MVLSATHTHSGAAGYMQYVLFEVSSLGFIEQTFNAMVDGIARVCIRSLHKRLKLFLDQYTEAD